MSDLYLKQLQVGPMQNFVYLIGSKSARECFVVDPAWSIEEITQAAQADGQKIVGALATHYHPDHVGGHYWGHDIPGLAELVGSHQIPVYAHTDEIEGILKLTGLSKSDFKVCRGGDVLELGSVKIKLIHTPGHTPGSQCFLAEDCLVSGDTLFVSGCGRVDLPGGDPEKLYESLSTKLSKLPKNTILYPGHHYDPESSASLEVVQKKNPYLNVESLDQWRRMFGL